MNRAPDPRGFSLIELMMATTIALVVIAGAISAGTYLQRRSFLEERTMETQNAARAARDLFTPVLQRAGEGFGSSPLYLGGAPGELRYAINVTSQAGASSGYVPPGGAYTNLRSDVLEIFEADSARSLRMRACPTTYDARLTGTSPLCLRTLAPPGTDAGLPTGSVLVAADPSVRGACVGVAQAARNVPVPGETDSRNIAWTVGAPGATAFNATSFCTNPTASALWEVQGQDEDPLLMPVTSRIYRVNWSQGRPALELDPDGSLGPEEFRVLSEEIEQLRVRLGVATLESPSDPLRYFPDPAATPARPPIDQCTNAQCWGLIPGDAGTMGAQDYGPGSARDELMRRVRVVELLVTARSARPDRQAARGSPDAGTLPSDDEGNPDDGYKRRHFLIRVTPRNFGYAGG